MTTMFSFFTGHTKFLLDFMPATCSNTSFRYTPDGSAAECSTWFRNFSPFPYGDQNGTLSIQIRRKVPTGKCKVHENHDISIILRCKDRASLSVLLAVVSVGIVSLSAPLVLELDGLQEAVELDSEVELLEPEHAAVVQLFVETRVTWLMRTTPT